MKSQGATTWSLETIERLRLKLVPSWTVCWCGDPWTQFGLRIIHMQVFPTNEEIVQCFLHEACHALRGKGGHEQDFWDELEVLVREQLDADLVPHQLKMMNDYLTP